MAGFVFKSLTQSTMDDAAALVRAGNPDAVYGVLAAAQGAGRGRMGRVWQTFASRSLAVTLMTRIPGEHLPLVVALGVYDALCGWEEQGRPVAIKWPNDLLLDGKKVAGILIETLMTPEKERVALVGIGLNLTAPEAVPEAFEGTFVWPDQTTVWNENTLTEKAGQLRTCVMQQIDLYATHGWTPEMCNRYTRVCATLGRPVTWMSAPGGDNANTLTGTARGLTDSGHLELVAKDGTVHILYSGLIMEPHTTA